MHDLVDNPGRLAAVNRYRILDTPPEEAFDRITAMAARVFEVPIALLTVVDRDRIWIKSCYGLAIEQLDLEPGLCLGALAHQRLYTVPDTRAGPPTATHSLVQGAVGLRFYAAAPLMTDDGYPLGTLCIGDRQPRQFDHQQLQTLVDLAALAMDRIALRADHQQARGEAQGTGDRQPLEGSLGSLHQLNQVLEARIAERTAELEASNRRFRHAFDYAGIGMALVSLEGRFLQVNRSLCTILGYEEAELLATTFQALTHPDDLQPNLDLLGQLLNRTIGHYHLEKRYRHRRGHWIWAMLSVSLATDPRQEPLYLIAQVQNIDAQKQAELALRHSQALLLEAQAIGHLGSWEYDVATQRITWSPEKFRILGRDPALGEPSFEELLQRYHPDDGDQLRQAVDHTLATGQPYQLRLRCTCDDGTIRYIDDRGRAEVNDQGEVVRLFGIAQDITDRIQAEQERQEMSTALALTVEGIARLDNGGCYTQINEAYAAMVGYTPGELLGQPWQKTVHPDDLPQVEAAYDAMVTHGKATVEVRGVRKDGSTFYKQLVMVAAYDAQQRRQGHYCFMKDVTERTQMEADRRRAELALQESEERYRLMVSALSEGLAVVRADGTVLTANASAARILGIPRGRLLGGSVQNLAGRVLREDGAPCPVADLPPLVALQTGQPQLKRVLGIIQPHQVVWVAVNAQPLFHRGQAQPYAVVVSLEDITELRQSEVAALRRRADQERLLSDIAQRIRQTLNLEAILNTTVTEVQQFLATDRVMVCRIDGEGQGTIIAEATAVEPSLLGQSVRATIPPDRLAEMLQGHLTAVADLAAARQDFCPVDRLTQAKAKVVVPIVQHNRLWGMLLAYHGQAPHPWDASALEVLQRLATHIAIAIQQSQLYQRLQGMNRQLEHLATHDGLTQVANRRSLDAYLEQEWARLGRERSPLSLILCDIDHFKLYNDTYGHPAGDGCLQQVAQVLEQVVKRPADLVARYGGEEFAVVLPGTDIAGAVTIAQDIQQALAEQQLFHGTSPLGPYITLSLGIASAQPQPGQSSQTLVDAADAALYSAKHQGRDRYCISPGLNLEETA